MNRKFIVFIILVFSMLSCKKFVDLDAPDTSQSAEKVFQNDASATSTITGILADLTSNPFFAQGYGGVCMVTGLMSDELLTVSPMIAYQHLWANRVLPDNNITNELWKKAYLYIYRANATIEGVNASSSLSPNTRTQLIGEAKFIRAFCHFYLVNLYGPIPVITSTNYEQNRVASRQPVNKVYEQIIADLKEAQTQLSSDYLSQDNKVTNVRIRPNKWAATALLARTHLYMKDWAKAETEATAVIGQSSKYSLDANLNSVFKSTAKEAIWHLPPQVITSGPTNYTLDGSTLSVLMIKSLGEPWNFTYDLSCWINPEIVGSFEAGDKRMINWIDSATGTGKTYHLPYKYKNDGSNAGATPDYFVLLRLAEQYLIRAEARIRQGNLSGAASDINAVRARAGLPAINLTTPDDAMKLIEQERRVELFTEMGHRWLDLKRWPGRTNPAITRADEVMSVFTPKKGGTWNSNWMLLPLPRTDISNGPNITQNPGYPQ